MGVMKKVINDLDKSKEVAEEIREALKNLNELAEMNLKNYYDNLKADLLEGKIGGGNTSEQLRVPITYTIKEYQEIRVTTAESTNKVLESITQVISGMVDDKSTEGILNGISAIVDDALDTILGAGAGMEQSVQCYAVTVDYPAIVRYDFSFWGRNIEAKGIRAYCESAIACVGVKSAVNVKALAFNDFLSLFGPVLNKGFGSDRSKMMEMIQKAKEVYKMYTEDALPAVDENLLNTLCAQKPRMVVHAAVPATKVKI